MPSIYIFTGRISLTVSRELEVKTVALLLAFCSPLCALIYFLTDHVICLLIFSMTPILLWWSLTVLEVLVFSNLDSKHWLIVVHRSHFFQLTYMIMLFQRCFNCPDFTL